MEKKVNHLKTMIDKLETYITCDVLIDFTDEENKLFDKYCDEYNKLTNKESNLLSDILDYIKKNKLN